MPQVDDPPDLKSSDSETEKGDESSKGKPCAKSIVKPSKRSTESKTSSMGERTDDGDRHDKRVRTSEVVSRVLHVRDRPGRLHSTADGQTSQATRMGSPGGMVSIRYIMHRAHDLARSTAAGWASGRGHWSSECPTPRSLWRLSEPARTSGRVEGREGPERRSRAVRRASVLRVVH